MADFEDHSEGGSGPIVFAFASENDFRFEWGHFLQSVGVPHVLFRDSIDRWYMYGVDGIGDVAAVINFIRPKCFQRKSIAMGLSKGGHGALRYAKLAGLDEVIAISPVTVVGSAGYEDFEPHWHDRVGRNLPFHIEDLKPIYAKGPNPKVSMFISNGQGCELDQGMAVRLGHGTITFIPNYDHGGRNNLAVAMRDNGMLKDLLK